ncbi:MAG TPA: hypothetical protein EYP25_05705 [Anaerolineae bacterium]|nr:hypothetical protein [Caldilineae bacterium]HID34058.1 hypothetical protein [Anaerolineae bacterium]HIQ11726.1 hypothetical protein [Caldilineales bacterium]
MKRKHLLLGLGLLLAAILLCSLTGVFVWNHFWPHTPIQKRVEAMVRPWRFDLLRYEADAIIIKAEEMLFRPGRTLSSEEQIALVKDYVALSRRIHRLKRDIERIYADPEVAEPDQAARADQQALDAMLTLQAEARPMVETILARQVTETMKAMGLDVVGVVWPPIAFRFSALPNYLIVSPRDRIELEAGVHLRPNLTARQKEIIEDEVAQALDRSTLIEALGGLGVWPTLVSDEANLAWILDTIAHEWVHTHMAFHPLGWHMFDSPQMNTINETVATIIGNEVGAEVAYRYYGIPKPKPKPLPEKPSELPPPDPNAFDFQTEMRRTRLKVDELLAQGRIDEAEAYMETRRREFVKHGYAIRKLNQAYFAFHGSYATTSASTDPIGPKLRELRSLTPDLATFMREVQTIRRPEDLDPLLESWRQQRKRD